MAEPVTARGPIGRRPGRGDTRGEIVSAAGGAFAEGGYDATSLRAVARRAGVDAALVHHYFPGGKPELFAATMFMGAAPSPAGRPGDGTDHGRLVVRTFLSLWEPDESNEPGETVPDAPVPFAAFTQAVAASPEAATAMREFLADRIWSRVGGHEPDEVWQIRHALVASHLMGLGMARYVLRLEPFASASVAQLEEWIGPVIDATLARDLTDRNP